jgi:hypothetical protein
VCFTVAQLSVAVSIVKSPQRCAIGKYWFAVSISSKVALIPLDRLWYIHQYNLSSLNAHHPNELSPHSNIRYH